jgi:hypothetical protein
MAHDAECVAGSVDRAVGSAGRYANDIMCEAGGDIATGLQA